MYTARVIDEIEPKIGDTIVFIDESRQLHHAVIARIYEDEEWSLSQRPRIMCAWMGYDGMWKRTNHVEPARHDGERWIVLQKWAYPDEIPADEIVPPGN